VSDLTLAQLIAFHVTLMAAIASPGPAFVLVLRNSIIDGQRVGILSGLGLGMVAALWTGAALMGLSAVFAVVPWLHTAIKIAGALCLIYLSWGMWRGAATPLDTTGTAASRRAFRAGLIVNLSNPKSVLFAGAVIVMIFPSGLTLTDSALIVANHLIVEISVYTAMACALSTPAARATYLRIKRHADRTAAAIMAALGLRLLLER
jgi:threonine/homoserine/homoserine lactone efflux protein